MKPTYFSKLRLPTILLGVTILSVTGCQSRNFLKPNFGFGKSSKMNLAAKKLPPPSTQFAPEPTEIGDETVNELVLDASTKKEPDSDDRLIREPYSLEAVTANSGNDQSNTFEGTPMPLMPSPDADQLNLGNNSLESLQNTMQQTPQARSFQGSPTARQSSNSIDGWNSDFEATPQSSAAPIQAAESFQPMSLAPSSRLNRTQTPAAAAPAPMPGEEQNGFGLPPLSNSKPELPTQKTNNLLTPTAEPATQSPLNPIQTPSTTSRNQFDETQEVMNSFNPNKTPDFMPPKKQTALAPQPNPQAFAPTPSGLPGAVNTPVNPYPDTAYPPIKPLIPNNTTAPKFIPESLEPAAPVKTSSPQSNIPEALRTGSGGFAPGSTKPMNPIDKTWQPPGNAN